MFEQKYGSLCNRLYRSIDGLAAVGIILDENLVVYKNNQSFQIPEDKERMTLMMRQAYRMINEPITNEDYFGKVIYVMVRHEILDVFLFRMTTEPTKILVVLGVPREYNHQRLVESVSNELRLLQ